jgi:glycosyltransferase involved in cell wall biosynthesis
MATYNRAHFIVETLQSIQAQTYIDWECLIIDDGGSDNTNVVISPFLEEDARFQFIKRPENYKKGLSGCRNYGLDIAKGDSIIFFDDDDTIHPDNLKICLKELSDNQIDFCHYQKLSYQVEKPIIKKPIITKRQSLTKSDLLKVITQEIGLASCTVMWKKHCFDEVRFNEKLLYAEEWECYSRLLSEGFKGIIIDAILYYNRKHPNSNTGEFYRNNPARKESKKEAMLLILSNLKVKQLLTTAILRYFVTRSIVFKEYKMFYLIINTIELSTFEKLQWHFFYRVLPLRLFIYKHTKGLKKRI